MNIEISRIRKFLKNHKNFLIMAHINPEGDCLGSELAFAKLIKARGKNYEIVNTDTHSREYAFLPGVNNILRHPKRKNFDAAVVLDCSDISRVGSVKNYLKKDMSVLNIDHHISNTLFGDINLVKAKASSTCEILYLLFKRLRVKLDKDTAVCLYAGIMTDTGSFRYPNTSHLTHLIISRLLKYNIDVAGVYRNIYENLSFLELKFINEVLANIKMDKTGKIAWARIASDMVRKYSPKIDITENILNFLRSLKGVEVCILFKENREKGLRIRVNLRSTGQLDVNKVAQNFGGGGHKTASGVTLKGLSLKTAENKIISFIKNKMSK